MNLSFLGFFATSNSVAYKFVGSFKVMIPALWRRIKALPPFEGSFGIATVAFFGISSIDFNLAEKTPIGSTWTPPATLSLSPFS